MKKSKVNKVMLSIDFFANRFGFSAKNAEWSVVRLNKDDTFVPAVYIGDDLYVDILADELKCMHDHSVLERAKVTKNKTGYLFKGDKIDLVLNSKTLNNLYKNKFVF